MKRRTFLKLLSTTLATFCTAIVAIPGVRYILAAARTNRSTGSLTERLIRLNDLPVGQPYEASVIGTHRDAWTVYPQEVLGRVWLLRRSESATPPQEAQVDAFSTVCPHLGCAVQLGSEKRNFFCPCHKAQFAFNGDRLTRQQTGEKNPAPRGLDALECRIVQDEQTSEWWVEVKYEKFEQGITTRVPKA